MSYRCLIPLLLLEFGRSTFGHYKVLPTRNEKYESQVWVNDKHVNQGLTCFINSTWSRKIIWKDLKVKHEWNIATRITNSIRHHDWNLSNWIILRTLLSAQFLTLRILQHQHSKLVYQLSHQGFQWRILAQMPSQAPPCLDCPSSSLFWNQLFQ